MKKIVLITLAIFTLVLSYSIFAQTSDPGTVPEECEENQPAGATIDADRSYSGTKDLDVGGCWIPPNPKTCVVCTYVYN